MVYLWVFFQLGIYRVEALERFLTNPRCSSRGGHRPPAYSVFSHLDVGSIQLRHSH
jgi:hypothetical protein